jgi:hypothetical protein
MKEPVSGNVVRHKTFFPFVPTPPSFFAGSARFGMKAAALSADELIGRSFRPF